MSDVARRLAEVRERIGLAAERAGREATAVHLIAVSKAHPAGAIREAYAAGQRDFGENYVQELVAKQRELSDLPQLRWHAIGRLQRNKARHVVGCALVHAVDRADLAHEIDRRAAAAGHIQRVLVEVNVAAEASKGGVAAAELAGLLRDLESCGSLRVDGLMTIPPALDDPASAAPIFRALARLRDEHRALLGRGELSMGMSGDFAEAIAEGATLVRVGTAIFGSRS